MKVAIIGANGQVASEVIILLSACPGLEVRPIARSTGGSAFLRSQGIPMLHGDISDNNRAREMLAGADVVANFALASGSPPDALSRNSEIIRQSFEASPAGAVIVFFSSLSVHGQYNALGQREKTFYGQLKLANEKLVGKLARRTGRKAYIFRLGHVAGVWQGITESINVNLRHGVVRCPDPERFSNVTFTKVIADALVRIARGSVGAPGTYDLVNQPQWSWRQIFDFEAERLGTEYCFELIPQARRGGESLINWLFRLTATTSLKQQLLRRVHYLPQAGAARLQADYNVSRARSEIGLLRSQHPPALTAMLWPAMPTKVLTGLRNTQDVLQDVLYRKGSESRPPWPMDLTC